MGKIIGLFFPFLILFFCVTYFFVEYVPPYGGNGPIVIMRVTKDGEPLKGAVRWDNSEWEDSTDFYSKSGQFACMQVVYLETTTALSIVDEGRQVLFTVPTSELKHNDRLNIDLNTGKMTHYISFGQYFTGIIASMGISWILLQVLFLGLIAYFLILIPIGFLAMVYSIIREWGLDVKRRFAGSYLRLIFGLAIGASITYMLIAEPEQVTEALFQGLEIPDNTRALLVVIVSIIMVGYPLYLISCRSFNAAEMRAQLAENALADLDRTFTFTYTKTSWSDGTTTSDYGTKLAGRGIAHLLIQIPKFICLPITSYWCMVKYYLVPILNGCAAWKFCYNTSSPSIAYTESDENSFASYDPQPQSQNVYPTPPASQGATVRASQVFCENCGAEQIDAGRFCEHCGSENK